MLKRIYTTVSLSGARVIQNPSRTVGKFAAKTAGIKLSNGSVYTPKPDVLVVVTRAISARTNQNYDSFPSAELKSAHKSFIGRPVFVNHNNEDHKRSRGIIIDSTYKEAGSDKYIELLLEVDAKNFPRLASLISTGELDSVSMGTDVEFTRCSFCNNKAFEVEDFCTHVRNSKGKTLSKVGSNGSPQRILVSEYCFPEGTPISLSDGSTSPIEEIAAGDQVLDHLGHTSTVTQTMSRLHNEPLISIERYGFFRPLQATSNHPILGIRNTKNPHKDALRSQLNTGKLKIEFIPAGELQPNDWIAEVSPKLDQSIAKIIPAEWEKSWGKSAKYSGRPGTSLPDSIEMNYEFGRFCGWFLAEGSIHKGSSDGNGIRFALHGEENIHAAEIVRLSKDIFGLNATISRPSNGDNGQSVNVFSASLARFMRSLGEGFVNKSLPKEWLNTPLEFIEGVVSAHRDGDGDHGGGYSGGIRSQAIDTHLTSSTKLAEQLYLMHLMLGHTPTRRKPDLPNTKNKRTVPGWNIRARSDKEQQGRFSTDGWVFNKISSINKEDFSGTVYNLEVAGSHTYVADGIGVHNCYGLNFFEISFVFDPADESALMSKVYLPKHSKVASMQKRSLGEVTSPEAVDTLRQQEDCPRCGDNAFNGDECNVCNYVRPPDEMQDPDTMKSRVLQIVRKDPANGKEGRHMPTDLKAALARQRLAEAQRRLADADMSTDQARDSDSTDPTKIDQQFTSEEEARKPDDTTDVTELPEGYKSSSSQVAKNRAAYLNRKADFGQDDPAAQAGAGQGMDPQAAAPGDSDGPNSGPPSDDTPGDSGGIDGLPIDWKQDQSGQPYGTVQGTDLDIFVNEDMSWQVLPEGSTDPVAQGQGSSYDDCVQQAFQQAQSLGTQDSSQDPNADPSAAPAAGGDPSAPPAGAALPDPNKTSNKKKAEGETPKGAEPDERTDVEKLPTYETLEDGGHTYNPSTYDDNAMRNKTTPVDGSDVQNFAPGGGSFKDNNKSAARKTSAAKAVELAEAYIEHGIVANNRAAKFKAVAEIEGLPAAVVNDRIHLLSQVEAAAAKTASRPKGVVPQRAAAQNLPKMARAASFGTTASTLESDDNMLFISR